MPGVADSKDTRNFRFKRRFVGCQHHLSKLEHGDSSPAPDVEHAMVVCLGLHSQHICSRNVGDVYVIAELQAILVTDRRQTVGDAQRKAPADSGVRVEEGVSRSLDIRVAHASGWNLVTAGEAPS